MQLGISGLLMVMPLTASAAENEVGFLYRTVMLRAAPGELAEVIKTFKSQIPDLQQKYAPGPFWMRHSQGDQWDLLLLYPLGKSFADYHGETELEETLRPKIAWREELLVWGPPPEVVAARFEEAGYFHVEIFLALAGKRRELLEQRQMENVYLTTIGRPENLIFSRAGGAAWDCYTIGFYRDIKHFAESADVPSELEEKAAVKAGFESASTIGTYLRELIAAHHDTLAVSIR